MHGFRATRLAALAGLGISIGGYSPSFAVVILLIPENSGRLVVADVTVDYYSILTTTATNPSPVPTYVMDATVEGIASVSVQADGETVYAETVVALQ